VWYLLVPCCADGDIMFGVYVYMWKGKSPPPAHDDVMSCGKDGRTSNFPSSRVTCNLKSNIREKFPAICYTASDTGMKPAWI